MSRRKQAKPRAVLLKHEDLESEMAETIETRRDPMDLEYDLTSIAPRDIDQSSAALSIEQLEDEINTNNQTILPQPSPSDSDTIGTDPSLSAWNSEIEGEETTADEDQISLSPSSCPTPNSLIAEGNDPEVNFTIGPTESTPYACQFCEKAFPRLSYLKKHEQSHSDQMPFQCDFCQRFFKHKRSRDRHVKLHTGDKKYRCPHCESAFSRSDHLKIHMKTHDHQKPYQCVICNRGYNTAAALTSHMQNHKKESSVHSTPSPGGYRCLQCTGTFMTGEELQSHVSHHHRPISSSSPPETPNASTAPTGKKRSMSPKSQASSPSAKTRVSSTTPGIPTTTGGINGYNGLDNCTTLPSRLMLPFPMPKLSCIYCTKDSFPSMESLQLHVQAMHNSLVNGDLMESPHHLSPIGTPSGTSPTDSVVSSMGQLQCNFCTMKFSSLASLQKHAMTVHSLSSYLQAKAKENAFCAQCALAFPNSIAYAEHFLIFHANPNLPKSLQVCSPELTEPPQVKPTDLSKKKTKAEPGCSSASSTSSNSSGFSNSSGSSGGSNRDGGLIIPSTKKSKRDEDENRRVTSTTSGKNQNNSSGTSGLNGLILPPGAHFHHQALMQNAGAGTLSLPFGPHSLLCNQCNAGFSDFESFRTHLKSHLEEIVRKYTCEECESEFNTEDQLESHAMVHYLQTSTEYGCQSCLKLFTKPDELQKHLMDIHAHHLYRCALCKEMFDSKVSIQVHFAVKHSNECKLFRCTSCTSVLRSELEFQVHVKMAHLRKLAPYRCLLCNAPFGNELDLQFHLSTHQKQFHCRHCDESFHVEFLLDKHMQTHHTSVMNGSPRSHPDPSNTLVTSLTNNHSIHPPSSNHNQTNTKTNRKGNGSSSGSNIGKSSNGGGLKELKCDICDKAVSTESELTNHRKQVHHISTTGNPGYSHNNTIPSNNNNSASTKTNQTKSNLNASHHQSPTLSLHCAYCNENCKNRTDLENHMKTHQIVSTGKQKCNICDQVSYSPHDLAEHKLTHCKVVTGSQCTGCKQTIMSEEQFYTHIKQHCGIGSANNNTNQLLPLPCIVCRQTLMNDIEIQMHAKFHTKQYETGSGGTNNPSNQVQCCLCLRKDDKSQLVGINGFTNGTQSYVCADCCRKSSALISPPKPSPKRSNNYSPIGSLSLALNSPPPSSESSCNENLKSPNYTSPSTKKSYQCIKCQMTFNSEDEVQSHVTTHLMNEGSRHECRLCNTFFDTPLRLQAHLIEHTFEGCSSFSCYFDSTVFSTATGLQAHMLEHGINTRPYNCTYQNCHLEFFFRAELENHLLSHDEINKSIIEKYNNLPSSTLVTEYSKPSFHYENKQYSKSENGHLNLSHPKSKSSQKKRKKFFYRSDDSDEELMEEQQIPLSTQTNSNNNNHPILDASVVSVKEEKRDHLDLIDNNSPCSPKNISSHNGSLESLNMTNETRVDNNRSKKRVKKIRQSGIKTQAQFYAGDKDPDQIVKTETTTKEEENSEDTKSPSERKKKISNNDDNERLNNNNNNESVVHVNENQTQISERDSS